MKKVIIRLILISGLVFAQSPIRNIDYIEFGQKVITIPDGYYEMREHGNILEYNGGWIFTSTCVKKVNNINEYSIHYWTATNKNVWNYGGKLNLTFEAEDPSLTFYDNQFHIYYENKSEEKQYGFHKISYEVSNTLSGNFAFWGGDYGYSIEKTGIVGIEAVYSPLSVDKEILISDYRTMPDAPDEENIGVTYWNSQKGWSELTSIILAKDYGYDSFGVGGSVHQVDDIYILETVGLINWYSGNGKWVNGIMECETLTGEWRMLNKALTDKNGKYIWTTYFKEDGKWYALAQLRSNETEIYLAEIVEKNNDVLGVDGEYWDVVRDYEEQKKIGWFGCSRN